MNTRLLRVTPHSHSGMEKPSPRISFTGNWLYDIGFLPGVLTQVIPQEGGVDFRMCDENITSFRELFFTTRGTGGGLVRVYASKSEGHEGAAFSVSGHYILSGGLAIGDPLIAEYGYGIIRVRKIDPGKLGFENLKIVTVSQIKYRYSGPAPKLLVRGDWLSDIGFKTGEIAMATPEPGVVTVSLIDSGAEYLALQKYVRAKGLKILQVGVAPKNHGERRPSIFISGSCIEKAGFSIGDTLACSYGQGVLKFQTLGFEKLGFC